MAVEITDYVDVPARLGNLQSEYTVDFTSKVLLIPMNFVWDDDIDPKFIVYPRLSGEVVEALSDEGVPVDFIGKGSEPEEIFAESFNADFFLPTLFFSFSLWTQNPHLIEIAINVMLHFTVKTLESFNSSFRPNQVVFSAVVEIDEDKTTKIFTY